MSSLEKRDRKIAKLNSSLLNLEEQKLLKSYITDREFRHRSHKKLFEEIRKQFQDKKRILEKVSDLEVYVKCREKKILNLEQYSKKYKTRYETERNQQELYLQDLASGSKAFSVLQQQYKEAQNELESISNNYSQIFNEKNELEKRKQDDLSKQQSELTKLKLRMNQFDI